MFSFKTTISIIVAIVASVFLVQCATHPSMQRRSDLKPYGTIKNNLFTKYKGIIKIIGKDGSCTAFVIDGMYALTAAHCLVKDGKMLKESFKVLDSVSKDTKILAQAAAVDINSDLGVVRGDFKDFSALDINPYGFELMDPESVFISCGFPRLSKYVLCTLAIPQANYYDRIRAVGILFPGQSGGPVINLRTNKVVAINSAIGDGYTVLIPLSGVLSALGIENDN